MVREFAPLLLWVLTQDIVIVAIQSNIVLVKINKQIVCSQNLGNLNQLIVVIFTLEEWFFLENHTSEHAPKRPDIKGVIVGLKINQEFWALEVS